MDDNTNNTQQQTTNSTPEETGGKTFTQEQVNQIVSDRLAREREQQTGGEDYKAKYEAAQRELDSIKAGQTRAEKEAAVCAYFENKDIIGKGLEIAMLAARAEIDGLVLDGGKITDTAALDAMVTGALAPLVSHTVITGATTFNPAANSGGPDRLADAFKPKI